MTDLIERLRDEPTWHEKKHGLPRPAMEVWHQTSLEAANEIERLTAIVESPSAVIIQAGVWHARLDEIERLQARVDKLEGVLDRVDYALKSIWAIDRDRLRQLIANAATEQVEALEGEGKGE